MTSPCLWVRFISRPETGRRSVLHLTYNPVIDAREMGLIGAGVVIFRGPCLSALSALKTAIEPIDRFETIRIEVLSHFRIHPDEAHTVPQTFTFDFETDRIASILARSENPPYPLDQIKVRVNGDELNLKNP